MMNKVKVILFLVTGYSLTSCDPAHSLAVYNATALEKRIEVIGIQRDSVPLSHRTQDGKLRHLESAAVELRNDSLPSFAFVLGPSLQATLEFGFGTRPITDQIIIDKMDTVTVRNSKGRVKKKPFAAIGGDYIITIKE